MIDQRKFTQNSRTRVTDVHGYEIKNGSSVMLLNASRSVRNSELGVEKLETERLLANH